MAFDHSILKRKLCPVCGKMLNGTIIIDSWGNKIHNRHDIIECSSCGRFCIPVNGVSGIRLRDGRCLCDECTKSALSESKQVESSMRYAKNLLSRVGFRKVPTHPDLHLVNRNEIINKSGSENALGLARVSRTLFNNRVLKISSEIYILSHLPEVQFRAVLAHELLHTWVAIHDLKLGDYEEALCNIGSTLVYNMNLDQKLSRVLNERMKQDQDPVYGIKYMELKSRLKIQGWQSFINEILKMR